MPIGHWKDILIDFITGLPMFNKFDAILVVINQLIKIKYFIITNITANTRNMVELFLYHIY